MSEFLVVRPGRFTQVIGYLFLPFFVWLAMIAMFDPLGGSVLAVTGCVIMLAALMDIHWLTINVKVRADRVRIEGRIFVREFDSSDIVAVGAHDGLCFFLRTGEAEDVEFAAANGAYARFLRPRVYRIIDNVRRELSLENVPSPLAGTDPPWDRRPAEHVVRRTINWPSPWILVPWGLWVLTVIGHRLSS